MPDSDHRRVVPFAVVTGVGLLTLMFPPYVDEGGHLVAASVLLVLVVVVGFKAPRDSWWAAVPPMLFFLVVMVLRDGTGAAPSGLAPLVGLPVMWIALYGTRAQMWMAAAATGVVFLVPVVLVGEPDYPLADWRRALLWLAFAGLIGAVVQDVVRKLLERDQQQTLITAHLDGVLRAATEHSILATTLDGTITTFNEGAERMLGYRADELVGKQTPALLHDPNEVAQRAAELGIDPGFDVFVSIARRDRRETREWTYLAKDGTRVPVRLTVTAIEDEAGQTLGFMGIAADITAEKEALEQVRLAEQRWRVLLGHLPDTSVLTVGPDLRYRVSAGHGLSRRGMTEAVGKTLSETSSPENTAILEPVYRAALGGAEASVEVVGTYTGATMEIVAVPLPPYQGSAEALVVARDVSETRLRERLLRDAHARFARLFAEASNGIAVLSPVGVINDVNPALCEMVGRPAETLIGQPATALGGQERTVQRFLAALRESPNGRLSQETRLRHADGHMMDVAFDSSILRDEAGGPDEILINAVDISERRRYEAQLAHLADHDPLTGLANRRRFDVELTQHLLRCQRYGARGALLMLDLDEFKEINDTLGHAAGDQVIVSTADLLRSRLRKSDLVARLGGDEFAILLPQGTRESAEQVAINVGTLVRERAGLHDGNRLGRVTASIGVVMIEDPEITVSDLMRFADRTMYDAKESGRDRYIVHEPAG